MQLFGVRQYFVGTGCSVQSVEFCGLELDAASGWIPARQTLRTVFLLIPLHIPLGLGN